MFVLCNPLNTKEVAINSVLFHSIKEWFIAFIVIQSTGNVLGEEFQNYGVLTPL